VSKRYPLTSSTHPFEGLATDKVLQSSSYSWVELLMPITRTQQKVEINQDQRQREKRTRCSYTAIAQKYKLVTQV